MGCPLSDVDASLPKEDAIPRPNDVALVIGIEKYQKVIPARHARADAEQVTNYLRQLGYAPRNVTSCSSTISSKRYKRDDRISPRSMNMWIPVRKTRRNCGTWPRCRRSDPASNKCVGDSSCGTKHRDGAQANV